MDEVEVLRAGYDQTLRLVDTLGPDDLARPTPCPDWDVRALLVHVVASTDGLVAMLRGETPDWGRDGLGDDPAAAVRRSLTASVEAWSAPGATATESQQMAGRKVVDFAMGDAVAHAWDLSAALGRPCEVPDEAVQAVLDRWQGQPADTGRQFGAFGPRVAVPDGAPVLDRLLGELGRDARWRPRPQ